MSDKKSSHQDKHSHNIMKDYHNVIKDEANFGYTPKNQSYLKQK